VTKEDAESKNVLIETNSSHLEISFVLAISHEILEASLQGGWIFQIDT